MSMLAERRQKVRYVLNPRKKYNGNDGNGFALKMMQKMGWNHGKGLGANENGNVDPVRVSVKNNTEGMGFEDKTANNWTEHEDNFTDLLKSLQNGDASAESDFVGIKESLEVKSKQSRVRVHYQKFTKGKDLSLRSEKDLAAIFGRKTLLKEKQTLKDNGKVSGEESGKFTTGAGTISDYFKKKMEKLKNFQSVVVKKEDDEDSDYKPYIGFGFTESCKDSADEKSNRKRKCEDLGFDNPNFNDVLVKEEFPLKKKIKIEVDCNAAASCNEVKSEEVEISKIKKKKKKNRVGIADEIPNLNYCSSEFSFVDETGTETKKRRRKSKVVGVENPNFNDSLVGNEENAFVSCTEEESSRNFSEENANSSKPSKKKKKSAHLGIENPNFEENISISERNSQNFCEENTISIKSSKKKKRCRDLGIENPNFEDKTSSSEEVFQNLGEEDAATAESSNSTKKKKKKADLGIDNPNFDEKIFSGEEQFEKSSKKKRKNKQLGIDNPNFEDAINNCFEETVPNSTTEEAIDAKPIKNKKKKKKSKDLGIDNPNFEDKTSSSEENTNLSPKGSNKKKKKLKTECSEVENPTGEDQASQKEAKVTVIEDLKIDYTNSDPKSILVTTIVQKNNRKSVHFDETKNTQVIIPTPSEEIDEIPTDLILGISNEPIEDPKVKENGPQTKTRKQKKGISNEAFNDVQERVEDVVDKLDIYEAEVENDLNEKKEKIYIGEEGEGLERHAKCKEGTRLSFKRAKLSRSLQPHDYQTSLQCKKSYKHLVKGDVVLEFNNTNLHTVDGYASQF